MVARICSSLAAREVAKRSCPSSPRWFPRSTWPPAGSSSTRRPGSSRIRPRAMRIDIVSIFPDYFAPLDVSLLGKARRRGVLDVHVHDLRSWTHDRHRTVDDTPYGGGPGMVMKPEPWGEALDAVAPPEAATVPRLVVPT